MAGVNDLILPGGWRHDQQGRRIIRVVDEDTALSGEVVRIGGRVRAADGVEEIVMEGIATDADVTAEATARALADDALDARIDDLEAAQAPRVEQKDASHTLELVDAQSILEMNSNDDQEFTIPLEATVAFPAGSTIEFVRLGGGAVTIVPTPGVVMLNYIDLTGTQNRTIPTRMTSAVLYKRTAVDQWVLSGSLA